MAQAELVNVSKLPEVGGLGANEADMVERQDV